NMYQLLLQIRKCKGVIRCYPFGETHHVVLDKNFDEAIFRKELSLLKDLHISRCSPTIEDMFIKLMEQ
ncbi:MAG: ABC transporter ATP-binding protein, partial [Bacteroidaceae bacterium]|nr:ABC transporter ATP-binding protein [Bacteroidaceae bacterium]